MFEQARLEHALDHRCGRAATEQPASIKQAHRPTYASDDRESCLRCVVSVLTLVPEFTGDFSQTAVSNLLTEDVLQQILSCSLWLHCRTHAHTHAHTHAYIEQFPVVIPRQFFAAQCESGGLKTELNKTLESINFSSQSFVGSPSGIKTLNLAPRS